MMTPDSLTFAQLRERRTITVGEAAAVLGIGRNAAYQAAREGEIPTLRFGERLVVPVPKLLKMLGIDGVDLPSPSGALPQGGYAVGGGQPDCVHSFEFSPNSIPRCTKCKGMLRWLEDADYPDISD